MIRKPRVLSQQWSDETETRMEVGFTGRTGKLFRRTWLCAVNGAVAAE